MATDATRGGEPETLNEMTQEKAQQVSLESEKERIKGNYVSEWFGQRIYPTVRLDVNAVTGGNASTCPFLTDVLRSATACVKGDNSHGVCTINSSSNGSRQDWLVCPLRVIDSDIVRKGCRLIFGLQDDVLPLPVSVLKNEEQLEAFKKTVADEGAGYLFFQNKLGGEISVISTEKSPEMSFDVTLVEIRLDAEGRFSVSRYGILEIQTMDFHGSYKSAVRNLRDALRLHKKKFAPTLQDNQEWSADGIEGPNIANVFKRTFYQMMLKFKLAGEGAAAAGTIMAVPKSVWDSWQPFLGAPELEDESPAIKRFQLAPGGAEEKPLNAFICVFDLDADSENSISPVRIEHFVRVSPEKLAHHAFTVVSDNILHAIRTTDSVMTRIKSRLGEWWPEFQVKQVARRGSRKTKPVVPAVPTDKEVE